MIFPLALVPDPLMLKGFTFMVAVVFGLGGTVLWIWALIDCGKQTGADVGHQHRQLAWLVLIALTHVLGVALYFIFGRTLLSASASASPAPAPQAMPRAAVVPPPVSPQPGNRAAGLCPKCGAPLSPDAPEGLCPRCLLQMNLGAPTQFPGVSAASFTTAAPPPPPEPEEIAKHFPQLEILECLGRGGMGVVYKARQPRLNRIVALKILAPGRQQDPQFAERFLREAQALAKLNHPNIVTVFDFGESDGLYYLLMEFVDGVTLRGLLQGGKIESAQALAIVPRICEALQYAHEQGVVHRDIKPENVLVDKQGRVKIADFGIARMLGVEGLPAHTRDRYVIGTPYYMAPEQVEHPLDVDHRADIYSLGVVFYEMLTGELPLGRFALPSQKVSVDVRLDDVVLRALEKEPQRRYQQAGQVKSDVETISGGGTGNLAAAVAAPPHTPSPPRVPTSATGGGPEGGAHFSLKAIFGFIWAALGLVAVIFVANERAPFPKGFPLVVLLMAFACMAAPLGTTILGWLAVGDIRRSQGRISGLWLAVFDGMLFPVLALDGLITLMCYFATVAAWGSTMNVPDRLIALFGLASLVCSLFADFIVIMMVVAAIRHPPPTVAVPQSRSGGGVLKAWGMIFLCGLVVLIVGGAMLIGMYSTRRVPSYARVILNEAPDPGVSRADSVPLPPGYDNSGTPPPPPSVPETPKLAFGHAIELKLRSTSTTGLKNNLFSFESGQAFSYTDLPSSDLASPEDAAWLAQHGVDVACVDASSGLKLNGALTPGQPPQTQFVALTNREAVSLQPDKVSERWEKGPVLESAAHSGWADLACNFLFKSAGGSMGKMEVSVTTDNPPGLSIKYQLLLPADQVKPGMEALSSALKLTHQNITVQKTLDEVQAQYDHGLTTIIVLIDAREKAEVLQAKLDSDFVRAAQVRVDAAQQMLEAYQQLYDSGQAPKTILDQKQANLEARQAELAEAQKLYPATPTTGGGSSGSSSAPAGARATPATPPPSAADAMVEKEIAAIEKLNFETNRQNSYLSVAQRPGLTSAQQVRLLESAFAHQDFESNRVEVLEDIIRNPNFSDAARAEIFKRINSLDFENNRVIILKMLGEHPPAAKQ